MSVQAVFWDYDNTILATADIHWKKHEVILAKNGIRLDEIHRKRIYENNGYQNWLWMVDELGLTVPEHEYLTAIDAEFRKHLLELQMRPGVAEMFQLINSLGIPQAIVTNARRSSAQPILDAKNITSVMQFVCFKEDYEGRKPEPAPYLHGFERMSALLKTPIDPKRCLAIEDDPKGVESAHRAGAIVIHRKLCENDLDCSYANYSCFHSEDFTRIIKRLLTARE